MRDKETTKVTSKSKYLKQYSYLKSYMKRFLSHKIDFYSTSKICLIKNKC